MTWILPGNSKRSLTGTKVTTERNKRRKGKEIPCVSLFVHTSDGTTLYVMRYMQNHHVHKTLRGMKVIITLDKYMIKGKGLLVVEMNLFRRS